MVVLILIVNNLMDIKLIVTKFGDFSSNLLEIKILTPIFDWGVTCRCFHGKSILEDSFFICSYYGKSNFIHFMGF